MEDILVVGGGINGAGIATDAAGRGLKVTLCEQQDLASATSSASSKLIHGGLRYLQQGEFRLVHEALKEREILLAKAPHIIHPLLFILPHVKTFRPAWLIRLGLLGYDYLARRQRLAPSQALNLSQHPAGAILQPSFIRGFSYMDCWVDDARLVILNAMQARELGAKILVYTELLQAQRYADRWVAQLQNNRTGEKQWLETRVLVNATGPWVQEVLHTRLNVSTQYHTTLVKGSHIVVPKLYAEDFAFILQHDDGRIIFVIPFAGQFSLIGTTEVFYQEKNLRQITISAAEIAYLCEAVNRYFSAKVQPQDVVWSYAGTRPLQGEKQQRLSKISRDYRLELNTEKQQAPLLCVFGGKITTYRRLAEHALQLLAPYFPAMGPQWTAIAPLPGGNILNGDFAGFCQKITTEYDWLPTALAHRYANLYGTNMAVLLKNCHSLADLGEHIAAGLYQGEVEYLMQNEWAVTAEDILWRRTKLGLHFTAADVARLKLLIRASCPT